MYDEYFECLKVHQEKYGPKTILLYMVGHFHEIYGIDNDTQQLGCIHQVAELLGVQITRKNKKILENNIKNPLMWGFPSIALDRYIDIFLEHNYTVVVVDQVTPPPNVQRKVTSIKSPGTYISGRGPNHNYLLSIYIEREAPGLYSIGLGLVDVATGNVGCYETYSRKEDANYSLDETLRFIQTYNPAEIIVHSRGLDLNEADLRGYWDVSITTHWHLNTTPKEYYNANYQNQLFGKIYKNMGLLSALEYLDLERMPNATIALVALLQFTFEHNEKLVDSLQPPEIWNDQKHLILANNAISQLNLVGGGVRKTGSVYNIINFTRTSMGHRLLKERLLNPIIDAAELDRRYSLTAALVDDRPVLDQLAVLGEIIDLEKLHRKLSLGLLRPCDFNDMDASYENIERVRGAITGTPLTVLFPARCTVDKFSKFREIYKKALDLDQTGKYNLTNITENFFRQGYNSELDALNEKITAGNELLEAIASALSEKVAVKNARATDAECVKLGKTDASGHYLQVTALRYKTLLNNFKQPTTVRGHTIAADDFQVEKNRAGNTVKLTSDLIKTTSDALIRATEELAKLTLQVFISLQTELSAFSDALRAHTRFVAEIDLYHSSARAAIKYNYCRPRARSGDRSRVATKQLRHAIIERLDESIEYVPHDITLDEETLGMLVYGVNCSGKSSCMKSIGIAICLAQAGFYVPAREFEFIPYHYLLTRIIGNDNLFKGLSSFAVEMSELRGILKRAGAHSLILGDEICHGTETTSAVSIVASSVITLNQLNANFVFATHLHQLSEMERITQLERVRHFHLQVHTDAHGKLVYDRRLVSGAGDNLYGIEVAKAMGLDTEFINRAYKIRKEILAHSTALVNTKQSRYNAKVFMDECQVCHQPAVDAHHIKPQELANADDFIGSTRKNSKANLVPLCKDCHHQVHTDKLVIKGYIMTADGIELEYTYTF